jgi:hypothetical protein
MIALLSILFSGCGPFGKPQNEAVASCVDKSLPNSAVVSTDSRFLNTISTGATHGGLRVQFDGWEYQVAFDEDAAAAHFLAEDFMKKPGDGYAVTRGNAVIMNTGIGPGVTNVEVGIGEAIISCVVDPGGSPTYTKKTSRYDLSPNW